MQGLRRPATNPSSLRAETKDPGLSGAAENPGLAPLFIRHVSGRRRQERFSLAVVGRDLILGQDRLNGIGRAAQLDQLRLAVRHGIHLLSSKLDTETFRGRRIVSSYIRRETDRSNLAV